MFYTSDVYINVKRMMFCLGRILFTLSVAAVYTGTCECVEHFRDEIQQAKPEKPIIISSWQLPETIEDLTSEVQITDTISQQHEQLENTLHNNTLAEIVNNYADSLQQTYNDYIKPPPVEEEQNLENIEEQEAVIEDDKPQREYFDHIKINAISNTHDLLEVVNILKAFAYILNITIKDNADIDIIVDKVSSQYTQETDKKLEIYKQTMKENIDSTIHSPTLKKSYIKIHNDIVDKASIVAALIFKADRREFKWKFSIEENQADKTTRLDDLNENQNEKTN